MLEADVHPLKISPTLPPLPAWDPQDERLVSQSSVLTNYWFGESISVAIYRAIFDTKRIEVAGVWLYIELKTHCYLTAEWCVYRCVLQPLNLRLRQLNNILEFSVIKISASFSNIIDQVPINLKIY